MTSLSPGTLLDRRTLFRKSTLMGIAAATGTIGAAVGIDTVAQSVTATATPTAGGDASGRHERLRERIMARRAARAKAPVISPDVSDVPYVVNGTPQQVLDIYLPTSPNVNATPVATTSGTSMPVVIWIHGGGWMGGSKNRVGVPYLLEDGYAIVSINYRLLQDAMFPAQIVDANAALAWVWEHAPEYGFDRNRIVVSGGSAGARSASLVAASANDGVTEFAANPEVKIAALIDFFGGTDSERALTKNPRRQARIEASLTPAQVDTMLPMIDVRTYVDAGDPPTLLVHGDQDSTVPIAESQELAAAMKTAGVAVAFETMPGRGHGMIHFQDAPVQEIVRSFLLNTLGPV